MGLETGTYISDLNPVNPTGGDSRSSADDHLRLLKSTLKNTFPNVAGAVTPSHATLNKIGTTAAPGTNNTDPASTAYVMATLASQSVNGAMAMRVVPTNSTTALAGEHLVLTNGAASTVNLPASPVAGSRVWVTAANGIAGNVIAGIYTIPTTNGTVKLRYVNAGIGWIIESLVNTYTTLPGKPTTVAGLGLSDFGESVRETLEYVYTDASSSAALNNVAHLRVCINESQTHCTLPLSPIDGQKAKILFTNGRTDNRIYAGSKFLAVDLVTISPGGYFVVDNPARTVLTFIYIGYHDAWYLCS